MTRVWGRMARNKTAVMSMMCNEELGIWVCLFCYVFSSLQIHDKNFSLQVDFVLCKSH